MVGRVADFDGLKHNLFFHNLFGPPMIYKCFFFFFFFFPCSVFQFAVENSSLFYHAVENNNSYVVVFSVLTHS